MNPVRSLAPAIWNNNFKMQWVSGHFHLEKSTIFKLWRKSIEMHVFFSVWTGVLGRTTAGWPDYSHPLQSSFQTQR